MDWGRFKGIDEGAFNSCFTLNTTMTYITNRFILPQLLAMYHQRWSSAYQHLWTSVTYSDEMQLPPVLSRLPKHSLSDFTNSAVSLSLKAFAIPFLYHASMLSFIISHQLHCLGPPMVYAHQLQNQSISKP